MIIIRSLIILMLIALPGYGVSHAAELVDKIVAVINGEIITLYELNERIKPYLAQLQGKPIGDQEKAAILDLKKKMLDKMVNDILLNQECARLKVTVTDVEVVNAVKQFRETNKLTDDEVFKQQIALHGLTPAEFDKKMREDILKSRLLSFMVRNKIVVTDEEVKSSYYGGAAPDRSSSASSGERYVRLGIILFLPDTNAKEVYDRIKSKSISFSQAAEKYSVAEGVGKGGDLGYVAVKDLRPEWKEAIKDLKPGGITSPFSIGNNEAILEVRELKEGEASTTAGSDIPKEEAEQIRQRIFETRIEARFSEYMEQLRSKAVIQIKL